MSDTQNKMEILVTANTSDAEAKLKRLEERGERLAKLQEKYEDRPQVRNYNKTKALPESSAWYMKDIPGPKRMPKSAAAAWDVFGSTPQGMRAMTSESEWNKLFDQAERQLEKALAEKMAATVQNGAKYFSQIPIKDYVDNAMKGSGKSAKESAAAFEAALGPRPKGGANWAWDQQGKEAFGLSPESGKKAKESAAVFEEAFSRLDASSERLLGKNLGAKFSAIFTSNVNLADKFGRSMEVVAVGADKLKSALKGLYKISPFSRMASQLKDLKKPLENFGHALKRIVMYRVIRGGLTALLRNWKEGLTNLYGYSQRFGTQFHNTMDSIATDVQYVSNGFAAMAAPIINAVMPAVQALAAKIVDLANAIGYFFAKILGQASFSAAIRGSKAFKELGGSAKEAKKQLMGFDELNVLTDNKGGGAGGADYGKMFEEWSTELEEGSLEQRLREAIENGDWEGVGSLLAEKMNGVVDRFKESQFGKNLGKKIQKGLDIAHGFLSNFSFTNAGSALAVNLSDAIKGIDWQEFGDTMAEGFTGAIDFFIGFLTDFDFSAAGRAIGDVVVGWYDGLSDWLSEVDWEKFGKTLFDDVYNFVTGIDFGAVASSFFRLFGTALSSAWDLGLGLFGELFTKVSDYFKMKTDECGGNAVLGFLKGILDGLVGIATWIYDNVIHPFLFGLTDGLGMGDDASPTGKLKDIGSAVIDAFFEGLTSAWTKVATWISQKATAVKNIFKGIVDGIKNFKPESPRYLDFGSSAGLFAEGGTVPTGQLFIANEAGPELVGTVGGRTTVTSQDQFTAGMADIMDITNSVIMQAAQSLAQTIINKDMTAVAVIGDRDVVRSYDRGKTLAGSSLVE